MSFGPNDAELERSGANYLRALHILRTSKGRHRWFTLSFVEVLMRVTEQHRGLASRLARSRIPRYPRGMSFREKKILEKVKWLWAGIVASVILSSISEGHAAEAPVVRFEDATAEAGLRKAHRASREPSDCLPRHRCQPESMTGGAAAGDFDGDGWVDLFVTSLMGDPTLYRNRGDGTFEDVTAVAGLDSVRKTNGAGWADLDNDGDLDLYVTTYGGNRFYLFINDGHGRFTEQAIQRGAALEQGGIYGGMSVAFGDYDLDGWVDIHTSEWRIGAASARNPSHARLLRNRGADAPGYFEDRTESAGVSLDDLASGGIWSFASAFLDIDGDSWPELFVASDFGTSRLFWNNGDGTFRDGTAEAGVGTDENGMGSTLADIDGDGSMDWFVTSVHDEDEICSNGGCNWGSSGNRLFRYLGARRFEDATDRFAVREGYWGWGAAFFDMDNDGDQDLVMTNGIDFPGTHMERPFYDDPLRLWRNDGGSSSMAEISFQAGLRNRASGKGLLVFDYDRDGDLDLFIVNNRGYPILYRNTTSDAGDWLRIRAIGRHGNRDALGTRITVIADRAGSASIPQVKFVGSVSHFLGQSERVVHFGLAEAAGASARRPGRIFEVRVRWPRSGMTQVFRDLPRNREIILVEPVPSGTPIPLGKTGGI